MRLVRFDNRGEARLGAVRDGRVVDLAAALDVAGRDGSRIPQSMRAFLAAGASAREAAEEAAAFGATNPGGSFSHDLSAVRLLAPVGDPQKLMCIGQNYRDHCAEQNQPLPEEAVLFAKFPTAIIGPGEAIQLPKQSQAVDYEAELAFVIGKQARNVSREDARDYVAGYLCLHDVSARDIQLSPRHGRQWIRGKTFDTFAPIGPWLVTADEIPDPHNLSIQLELNGLIRQNSNTSNLIFDIDYLIADLSACFTLEPGDIVTTGTPGGVGHYSDPPVYLRPGDVATVRISSIGELTNPVIAAD